MEGDILDSYKPKLTSYDDFSINLLIQSFVKICAALLQVKHEDRKTDITPSIFTDFMQKKHNN